MAVLRDLFVYEFLPPRLVPLVCGHWLLQDARGGLGISKTAAVGGFTRTDAGGTWRAGPITSESQRNNILSADDASYSFSWDVDLAFAPGTDRITITRTVTFVIGFKHWYGAPRAAASFSGKVTYKVPLVLTVTLSGAVDGKLQVGSSPAGASSPPPTSPPSTKRPTG